jgi:hypothetical protein
LEKIFASDSSIRGLMSRIYKELKKLNIKEQIIQSTMEKCTAQILQKKYKWPRDT